MAGIIVLYHPRAADHILRGCRLGRPATATKIAQLLTDDPDIQSTIRHECQDDSKRYAYWTQARNQLLTHAEMNAFGNLDVRRCPSCLEAVPKKMTKCLSCNGVFLVQAGQEAVSGVVSRSAESIIRSESITPILRTN